MKAMCEAALKAGDARVTELRHFGALKRFVKMLVLGKWIEKDTSLERPSTAGRHRRNRRRRISGTSEAESGDVAMKVVFPRVTLGVVLALWVAGARARACRN